MSEQRYADFLERWRALCFGVDPADESVPSVGFTQDVNTLRDAETKVSVKIDGREVGRFEPTTGKDRVEDFGGYVDPATMPPGTFTQPLLIDEREALTPQDRLGTGITTATTGRPVTMAESRSSMRRAFSRLLGGDR